jgi:hypothetical protein
MNCCHAHDKLIVVHEEEDCPVCEIIHDNFKLRTQLLTGAKLADYDICSLPKYIQKIFREISNRKKEAAGR